MNGKTHQDLYELIAKDEFEQCFDALETIIQSEAPLLLVELIMLRRRQESLRKDQRSGTLSNEDFRVEESKLARDLLYLIQQVPSDEEATPTGPVTTAKGKLLHDIPARFPLHRLTKCVIRIADTEAGLLQDYQAGADAVIETVPIERVMAVELIDIEAGENFEIKPLNSTAQQLLSGEASQWVYYVKALTPGEHLLVLRISTVEMIDGVERPKEVLFERSVRVEAEVEPRPHNAQRNWQPTNLTVAGGVAPAQDLPAKMAEESADEAPLPPPEKKNPVGKVTAPATSPPSSPSPAPASSSIGKTPWTKIAGALLLVVVAGWWVLSDKDDYPDLVPEPTNPPIVVIPDSADYNRPDPEEEEFIYDNDDDGRVALEFELPGDALIGTYRSSSGED